MDLHTLASQAKNKLDLASLEHQDSLSHLMAQLFELPELSLEQLQFEARKSETPLEFKMAAKLYESKHFLLHNKQPLKVGVILPCGVKIIV